jgi:phenylacetate-CoA ligase
MGKVETKVQDSIITPDGRSISPSVLTFPFKSLKGIVKSQLVQPTADRLVIKLVVDDRYNVSTEPRLIAAMAQRLGGNMTVSVEYVPDIQRTAAGKYRWVISDIAQLKANGDTMM